MRVDFLSYVERPEGGTTTTRLRAAEGYELSVGALGLVAERDGARCTYPLGAVRQWWSE